MLTYAVILTLIMTASLGNGMGNGFRMVIYSRSVDQTCDSQILLQSPCPNIFQYQYEENGNLIGTIKIDQTDGTGRIQLDVELSLGNSVQGYNGHIISAENREKVISDIMNRKPIYYKVLFPAWEKIPPKITKISVNNNLICSGPRIPIQCVPVLTIINLQNKLSLDVTPLISSSDPTVDSSSQFNNLAPSQRNDNQQPQYQFDIRRDSYPSSSNNVFTDFNPNPPPPPPPGRPRPNNPFLNENNPFNFNPQGPPPRRRRPPPDREPNRGGGINPQNPFLSGFSNSQPSRGDEGDTNNNGDLFFSERNEGPSVQSTTQSPPKRNTFSGDVNEICGRPLTTNQLVVNGQSVPRGAYPWLVAIFRQKEDPGLNYNLNYICSGSLISNRHVVTAAHCLKLEYRRVKPNEVVCVFGKLNIRKLVTTAPGELILEPDTITVHPDYQPGKANADIAMITFADPITFGRTIIPLCLWQGSNELSKVVGEIGTVVGWGRTEDGDLSSAEPRQVNMPIVSYSDCLESSSSTTKQALVEIISKKTFCAGFRNGSGPCNGDSGSAFLLRKNGVFYLRGIVSTALSDATLKSCNLNEYIVFADASMYLDWIRNIMKTT